LKGEIYEQLLSETGKIILHDEMAHGDALEARHPLYQLVKTEADARIALEIVREFSTVRLKGRNFQFGQPLTDERVEAIARGEIEPATVEILKSAYAGYIDEDRLVSAFSPGCQTAACEHGDSLAARN
jgi:hypothetical protein